MYTIGTAGHIDHGKTTLCKLLTGIDTDRLQEEKERGISIDLGFAHFVTPAGRAVGIVDVPGHERFIKNMVAGVSGIEAFLFTIAADEGIMPQTREHFDILKLLGVTRGIIVLTKCDLAPDAEWQAMVADDVERYLRGTPFEKACVIPVSRDDTGSIARLVEGIDRLLDYRKERPGESLFRMPIDRVFTLKGHGTIVTGTVTSGRIAAGEQVEILPSGLKSRVRSIQSFFHSEQEVCAGMRGALNIPDVEPTAVERGHTAATPGAFAPTTLLDARMTLLSGLPPAFAKLKSMTRIRFYVGTAEAIGRVFLLEDKVMEGGCEALVQMRLESAVVASRDDRFLVRSFSPLITIGGGTVLDPHPARHRRDVAVVERLAKLSASGPGAILVDLLARVEAPLVTAADLAKALAWKVEVVEAELAGIGDQVGGIERRRKRYHYLEERLAREGARLRELVLAHHQANPLTLGIDRGALAALYDSRIDVEAFNDLLALIAPAQRLVVEGALVRDADFAPTLDPETEAQFSGIEKILLAEGFVSLAELTNASGVKRPAFEKVFGLMVAQRVAIKLPVNLIAHQRTVSAYQARLVALLTGREKVSVGEIKEKLELTRKALIPLLEYFDEKGVTVRAGNERRLRQRPVGGGA
jgi:selenocysteine-specific elongation factor